MFGGKAHFDHTPGCPERSPSAVDHNINNNTNNTNNNINNNQ